MVLSAILVQLDDPLHRPAQCHCILAAMQRCFLIGLAAMRRYSAVVQELALSDTSIPAPVQEGLQ